MLARQSQPTSDARTVVGLVRVSTLAQSADGGLERQYTIIRRTVQQKGLNLLKIFEVVDVSGTEVLRCPAIQELLHLVESRAVQGICIADLDRLFRPDKPSDYAILGVFQTTGAVIFCGDSELDLSTTNGMLFGQIRSAISGFELSLMKERQEGGKNEKRLRGKCPTNHLTMPIGTAFDRAQDKWIYTPEIVRVQEIFRLFDSEGVHNYCELSRRTGINHASIRVILRNPIYAGWRVLAERRGEKRVSKNGKSYRVKVPRRPEDVIRVRIFDEPAVSQETFDRVQAQMASVKFNHIERYRSNMRVNLGAGLVCCGHCGEPLLGSSGKGTSGGYYHCKRNHYLYREALGGCKLRNLKSEDLDQALLALGQTTLRNPECLAGMITASVARRRAVIKPLADQGQPAALLADLKRRDQRLLQAFEGGAVTVEELRARRADIRQQMNRISKPDEPGAEDDGILKAARLIVKSALRFNEIQERADQKAALLKLFSKVLVRENCLVSFEFNPDMLPPGSSLRAQPVLLDPPVEVFKLPEQPPPFHKRCIKCDEVKPILEFYRTLNACNPCRSKAERERHLKRKDRRKS